MQQTLTLPVSGDEWLNVNELVQSMRTSQGRSNISSNCQRLEVINPRSNNDIDAGCHLQITSDPTSSGGVAYELLPEQSKEFNNTGGNARNSISVLDKWIRLLGTADITTLLGDAIVVLDIA